MSNDNKLENKELCEDKKELTQEELEQIAGGGGNYCFCPEDCHGLHVRWCLERYCEYGYK